MADFEPLEECFDFRAEILKALAFIPFGFGATASNAILIIAILRSEQLRTRHEIQVMCALSFADFVEALATLVGGVYRSTVILINSIDILFTPLQCMLLPHSWAWRWSDFATSFMLLTLTVDRLISVVFPLRYIAWGPSYTRIAIGVPFGLSLLLSLAAWYKPIVMRGTLSMLCMNVYLSPLFYSISKYMTSCATMLSIILYIPVVYLIRNQLKVMSDKLYPTQLDCQRRAQLKMTITVAISSCLTLFLDAIPRAIGIYGTTKVMTDTQRQCESAMSILFHLTKLNSMVNLFLYYHRNKAIRDSIRCVLCLRRRCNNAQTVHPVDASMSRLHPSTTHAAKTVIRSQTEKY
uniref:G-protein coupled receptors family 1 profile domain-containing protein n=1 Tax=Parascaris univalens TaxID=6257 RepID=A0A915ARH1_PARUN